MTAQVKRASAALAAAAAAALFSAEAAAQDPFDFLFGGFDGPRRARRAPSEPRRSERPPPRKRESAAPSPTKRREQRTPSATAPAATQGATAPSGPEAPPPPYDPQMTRLSEVLGALSFLRDLCGAGDGDEWRGKMSALLDADAPGGARRQRLTASFNRGFRGYELTYRACTPNARTVISRYLAEASQLTREITYRYGNP